MIYFSLPNMSNRIRWSMDLRWQKPDHPAGFYGMKDHLLFRTSKDPDYKIDWTGFEGDDRWAKQKESVKDLQDLLPVKINTGIAWSCTVTSTIIYSRIY